MMHLFYMLILCLGYVHGGNVLFFMPIIPKSNKMTWYPLAEEMAKRGHQVTTINPHKSTKVNPMIEEIIVPINTMDKITQQSKQLLESKSSLDVWKSLLENYDLIYKDYSVNLAFLKDQGLFAPTRHFDAIVIFAALGEPGYYIAHHFNATLVSFLPQQMSFMTQNYALGQPFHPALSPMQGMKFRHPMTFLERLMNTVVTLGYVAFRDYYMMPQLEALVDEHFPEEVVGKRPSLLELEKETGLAFQFGHPLLMDGLRPVAPNYVMIGMMNCRSPAKLPLHIEKFMNDSGDDGVILVSFGTVLQASQMSESLRLKLISVLGNVKQRVLMKWENEEEMMAADQFPANMMLSKWLPQQDILAHPKLRLFITHGGQSSSQEALCHKKPVIVIPVFGDQPSNGLEAQSRGYGISIPLPELTTENLQEAVDRVLSDPTFSQKAQEHGAMVMDQINTPLERAVWWLEYAMRYPGMKHMRSPVHDLHWTQYFLLDVIAFYVAILLILCGTCFSVCKCLCRKSKRKIE